MPNLFDRFGTPANREVYRARLIEVAMSKFAGRLGEIVKTTRRPEGSPARLWALSYENRPCEFIGEIAGPSWYTDDWTAWRAFVKTVFGHEELTAEELAVFRKCTGLEEPSAFTQREVWMPIGRRGGKSRVLALISVYLACCIDWTPYLVPGEKGFISALAAQRKQAAQIMGYVKGTISRHPRLAELVVNQLSESLDLEGQVTIEVTTASITAVRSRTVIAALCDEIAFWRSDEESANPDEEILNALRPAMLTIPRSMLLAASSRYARQGALWNAYRNHYGRPEGPLVWSADTQTMHPSVDPDFLAAEYEKDPVAAAAEYGLEWRSDIAAFVLREAVEACVAQGVREIEPRTGVTYRAFVDPSGGSADSMTLAIAHYEAHRRTAVLDLLREARPPFSPESVVREFSADLKRYKVHNVRGDHYAGEWPREQFRKLGHEYVTSDETKSEIYQAWLPTINSARTQLLDHPRLVTQACGLERRTSRAGRDTIDHAPGGHDDIVNAAAGALVLAASQPGIGKIPSALLARSRIPAGLAALHG